MVTKVEDDTQELTTAAIGKMKRRIADLLEPGETVKFSCLCLWSIFELSSVYNADFVLK